MTKKGVRLGRVQKQIMDVLWEHGPCPAKQVTELLSQQQPIAHSTVQTLLRQMEQKGAVTHSTQGRVFLFRARVQADSVRKSATTEFIERMFQGDPAQLVAYLLENEQVPASELARLRKLIDAKRK